MPKTKHTPINQPATKQDVENAIDELAQATEKGFQHMATKKDVARLEGKTDRLETKSDRLEAKVDRLTRGVEALLESSEANTQMLKEHRDLPDRVSRLERTVFRS